MSAPPLPETFGNYALGDFVEVASSGAISWLPQTPGWLLVGLVLLAVLVRYGGRRLQYWYRNRYRREAAKRLQQLAATTDQGDLTLIAEINRLLKLTALAAFSREQVASLSGEDWVAFLNQQCAAPPFSTEQRRLLAVGAYCAQRVEATPGQALIAACLTWVEEHENERDA